MDVSNRVNKVVSMYYNLVCCNVVYMLCYVFVCSLVIGVDFCFWLDIFWDYGIKCGDVLFFDNLEVFLCWVKFGSYYVKNLSIFCFFFLVVLKRGIYFGYWRKLIFLWLWYILLWYKCFLGYIIRISLV